MIDREIFLNDTLEYLKENRGKPKKEQSLAYKNLIEVCEKHGVSGEEFEEFFEEVIKND